VIRRLLGLGDDVRLSRTAVYVPSGYDPEQPTPLLLALHGAGGRGAQMIQQWRGAADAVGMLVVAPTEAGENEGYRFSAREREDAIAVLRWTRRHFNVDENRIHLTGVSRGGHLAWDLAVRAPTPWASLAPMIGGPRLHIPEGQNNIRYVENAAHLPIRDLQGRGDDSRLIYNLGLAFAKLRAANAPDAKLLLQDGHGHGFDFGAVDWKAFLGTSARDPRREQVVRLTAREGEGRSAWVEVLAVKSSVKEIFPLRVSPTRWNALPDDARRRFIQAETDKKTASPWRSASTVAATSAAPSPAQRFSCASSQRPSIAPSSPWRRSRCLEPAEDGAISVQPEAVDRIEADVAEPGELRLQAIGHVAVLLEARLVPGMGEVVRDGLEVPVLPGAVPERPVVLEEARVQGQTIAHQERAAGPHDLVGLRVAVPLRIPR
jgi:dienelactone hydrolase